MDGREARRHRPRRRPRAARQHGAPRRCRAHERISKSRGRLRLQLHALRLRGVSLEQSGHPAHRQRDDFHGEFARRILFPRQRKQEAGPREFPGDLLRLRRAELGDVARRGVQGAGRKRIRRRRVRLDRPRLSRRADAVRQRHHQPSRLH